MEAKLVVVVLQGRVELVRSVDAAPIDDHHDLFAGGAEGRHHLVDILAQLLGIKVWDDFIEDFRSALLDGADDTEQHAAGDPAPRAVLPPRLPFATFFLFDLALGQRACGQAISLGAAPPAQPGQGKAPHDRFVFIEQDDLTATCPVLQGGEFQRAIGEISWGGFEPSSGTAVAQRIFFKTQRTLSRPS
jgi:hypothetical protein